MSQKIERSEHDKIRNRVALGVPVMQIAKEYGVTYQAIHYIMTKASSKEPPASKKPSDDDLYTMYVLEDMSQMDIARKIGVSPTSVHRWVKAAELEKEEVKDQMPENLIHEYEYGGCSANYLAEHYGFTYDQIRHWLDKHGARKRTKAYQPRKRPATFARKGQTEREVNRR